MPSRSAGEPAASSCMSSSRSTNWMTLPQPYFFAATTFSPESSTKYAFLGSATPAWRKARSKLSFIGLHVSGNLP
ncbi:hypothetical protein KL933_005286 [Ogataea haglerorum]|nr:uncharacterized protein KL911_004692 [Ogataea haglerorum]KAG7691379.1 hypothetical protein KL915_005275 [Ogataea haglerorum]KAG7702243.1 hypothetical protein KL950_005293 [Ogataea haglerorum]KAG7723811.1 hypothetical protein KL933_005286 [Ogataea haglerorum]KAG7724423.1 hypothetical protein KL948_005266 [Ogataea haglerorum]KAG7733332.1 hypothetical protein KL932_005261 [Ogataea haglerorum]